MFNIKDYLSRYDDDFKIDRAIHAASCIPELRNDVLLFAVDHIKRTTRNFNLYRQLHEALLQVNCNQPLPNFDTNWCETIQAETTAKIRLLENEIRSVGKGGAAKQKAFNQLNTLASFHIECGDKQSSIKCYFRNIENCVSPAQQLETYVHIVKLCLANGDCEGQMLTAVSKAKSLVANDSRLQNVNILIASAILDMSQKNLKRAAKGFLAATLNPTELCVISPLDVALCGGLLSLATLDRAELKILVIDNPLFLSFLEQYPEVEEIVWDFYQFRFAACLEKISKLRPFISVDLFLSQLSSQIYDEIRDRSIIHYCAPFTSLALNHMCAVFHVEENHLEQLLMSLITDGKIAARLDGQNKTLFAEEFDKRSQTYVASLSVGANYEMTMKQALLRMNMLRNDFIVQ